MDCADHCICGDGHRDGLECNLLRGVLDEKSVLEFDSRTLCCWWIELLFYLRTGILLFTSPTSSTVYIL